MEIKAIETLYKGYKFRSRLEARWAVFFDRVGLKWEYEPVGFVLSNGVPYLPDFRVTSKTGQTQWYEIKPESITHDDKFSEFYKGLMEDDSAELGVRAGNTVSAGLLSGDPLHWTGMCQDLGSGVCPRCGELSWGDAITLLKQKSSATTYLKCQACDDDTPWGDGHGEEEGEFAWVVPHNGWVGVPNIQWELLWVRVLTAARYARQARFEHGQTPVFA